MPLKEEIICKILPGIAKGVVCDSKADKPIAGAAVTVLGTDALYTTGSDGEYLMLLPAASYTFLVEADGYQETEVEIKIPPRDPSNLGDVKIQKISMSPTKGS